MDIEKYLELIRKRLEANFDLYFNHSIGDYSLDLFGKFNMVTTRHVFTKKAIIDTMENYEYCLIKHFNTLKDTTIKNYTDFLIESIDTLVDPDENHMSTVLNGVVIVDKNPSEEIINFIKKFKHYKSFAFGFKGWVNIGLILVSLEDNYVVTNRTGRQVVDVYKY